MKLKEIAAVIRSKNSGPYELTLNVMLPTDALFEKVRSANVINARTIARLYHIDEEDVISVLDFPKARAIKATIVRPLASGALGERDVYGAQQHVPLMELEVEL